ncbi:serine/threonine-protein kinase PLK2-like [Centruroides sculpturatus]|uniref:serine/threonine-protein kinase PLK2-like n=1 Tax=Centruroides sculpturatus TaxID=218467 RepID=UPI000C6ECEB5|nr:serine/threonine-protein kinase PLK2-like [Centruroides sculpturatus]
MNTTIGRLESSVRKLALNNNNIELPEYIVDPGSKTTYLKGKFLGKGGFAKVHELTDLTTNKVYAGKIIPKSRLTKPHQKEKILREIDLHRKLLHKNVVQFHHFFEDKENVYIILEYCSRKSLVHVLKNRKVLTEPEVRYYMQQLAEGVQYIHSQGVIHRDLKLGNMFLSEDMEMKIGDFGLAARVGIDGNNKITVCGTPNYIAPEVLNMKGHSFEADIWAMGCIMYAMLVGHPPFETSTLNETYSRITSNRYTIPSTVSDSAQSLIREMLQIVPSDRLGINEILRHEFFCSGYMPVGLSASCCLSVPKCPMIPMVTRSSFVEPHLITQEMKKMTNSMSTLRIHNFPKSEFTKEEQLAKKENMKKEKESSFPSNLKQKLTSVLCPDKAKKHKGCTTAALYQMVASCIESMPQVWKGGEMQHGEIAKRKGVIPQIKQWVRTSRVIVMQLTNGTLQVNFSKDHTKIVLSGEKNDGLVTYINEDRHSMTFSLEDISHHGCSPSIYDRMQFALSMLQEFNDIENEDF